MRILITGSSGLVGHALASQLREAGHAVVPFDLAPGAGEPAQDICDRAAVDAALADCDGVIHLAAVSRVAWGEADPELCQCVNVLGTHVLLQAALARPDRPWFLFASSREVYGDPAVMPVTETMPMAPVNTYGRSKAAGERLVASATALGLRTAVLRLSNVYGSAWDHPDRAVPSLLWRAMAGEELRLTGPDLFFDFVHVEDSARGFRLAVDHFAAGGGSLAPVQLTTGVATSLGEVARLAIAITGSASPLTILPPRPFDVGGFVGAPDRAAAVLGWQARTGLMDGMIALRDILAERGGPPAPATMRPAACARWRDALPPDILAGLAA